jgi:hypothetical protein
MGLLDKTSEKVVQVKSDLLAKSIMEQISNGGVDYIDGFERMYSRLNKTYVPRNEHWRILTNADFSVTRGEYLGDGCYAWRPTGNIYLVTSRNELGVSFQIFDTLKCTQLTCFLEGGPVPYPGDLYSEFRRIKTRPHLSVMAYRDYRYNVVVDKYTNIFTIDNSDRPFVEELFKEGQLTEEAITRELMHDYNYSWPMMFETLYNGYDILPKNTVF